MTCMISIVYRLCLGETINNSLKIIQGLLDSYVHLPPNLDVTATTVSEFFQIFIASSAPSTLVALCGSPYPGNKLSTHASIGHFMTCCRNTLHKFDCALVVVEFCKLLRRPGS